MTLHDAITEATKRGAKMGEAAGMANARRMACEDRDELAPDWLSGEWAGESIPELLGDLLVAVEDRAPDDEDAASDRAYAAICEAFEIAADRAFYAEMYCASDFRGDVTTEERATLAHLHRQSGGDGDALAAYLAAHPESTLAQRGAWDVWDTLDEDV